MVEQPEFNSTLELLSDYVDQIGDDVIEEGVDDLLAVNIDEEDVWLTGHRCDSGDQIYVVGGHPDLRMMGVVYFFSLKRNLGHLLDDQITTSVLNDEDIKPNEDEEREEKAAEILLDKINRDEMAALRNYAYMMISGSSHETHIYETDSGSITGFNIATMIFPYERSFGIKEFYDAVQTVTEVGERGNRLLSRTTMIDKDEDDPAKSRINLNFGW